MNAAVQINMLRPKLAVVVPSNEDAPAGGNLRGAIAANVGQTMPKKLSKRRADNKSVEGDTVRTRFDAMVEWLNKSVAAADDPELEAERARIGKLYDMADELAKRLNADDLWTVMDYAMSQKKRDGASLSQVAAASIAVRDLLGLPLSDMERRKAGRFAEISLDVHSSAQHSNAWLIRELAEWDDFVMSRAWTAPKRAKMMSELIEGLCQEVESLRGITVDRSDIAEAQLTSEQPTRLAKMLLATKILVPKVDPHNRLRTKLVIARENVLAALKRR